ncbi:SNF2 family N-terminal domain-containing protein [Lophiotrema nucula]|uniref:SNF2 family N-terminal domain-containing protein n=1 Tax=Lophiotrema nucula TaxID=690887 RepID=A0A6A5Z949_9PLEO|nr:SNF2 family N-terminal domain-containing protein [Lophiotrema nucula]
MIYRAMVKLRGDMAELDSRLRSSSGYPIEGYCQMEIRRVEQSLLVAFSDGMVLGEVNAQLETALENMRDIPIDFEVLAPIKPIRETINRAIKEKDAIVRVNINIYGPRASTTQVGREFSLNKVYLQKPDYIRKGLAYDNPHMLKLSNFQSSAPQIIVPVGVEKKAELDKAEAIKKTISAVYSSLTRGHKLVGLEADDRIKTPLLQHQKEALDFMIQRESGPVSEEFTLWKPHIFEGLPCYRHTITNGISRVPQVETGGGILADEMGMGKTLSVLSLILRTLDEAHQWASPPENDLHSTHETFNTDAIKRRSRATLVLASSDLMINEWFQEIERHFDDRITGSLKTIKYHGQYRELDPEKLRDADLIITTYHTLASDFNGSRNSPNRNPLCEVDWYRLVLDEAHIIRRQSTGLNRTVTQLKARSRWCLTGTPVQNRLEDIGSLFAFIRVNPFDHLSMFRKYIAVPYIEGGQRRDLAVERLTKLMDSLCLRRTKDLIHLPDQRDRVQYVDLSDAERVQYEQTKKMMSRAIRNQVGAYEHKGMLGMFQMQLQLRILCNHGTYQQPFSWNRRKMHLQDEREDMQSSFGGDGEVTCSACKQTMSAFGSGLSTYRRYADICKHILCIECIEQSLPQGQTTYPTECPLCSSLWGSMNSSQRSQQSARSAHSMDSDTYFRSEGHSSKMLALMADVLIDLPTTKSIIFSCWTRTLDLLQTYLMRAQIPFQRIDGECTTSRREKILDDFAKIPDFRVLIMTTGTGAVGLNLATANRVFIVEPQWNPSVENQAVARAIRLGQEQSVQVTRYVVKGTVEQDMRSLQDTKLKLAGLAWES